MANKSMCVSVRVRAHARVRGKTTHAIGSATRNTDVEYRVTHSVAVLFFFTPQRRCVLDSDWSEGGA